jgi:hypothetical protein
MATQGKKRRRKANQHPCTSGVLFLRGAASVEVDDRGEVELAGQTWSARIHQDSLELTGVTSTNDKREQAKARRLDVTNEIAHRKAEAAALFEQRVALLNDMDQVDSSLPVCLFTHLHRTLLHFHCFMCRLVG